MRFISYVDNFIFYGRMEHPYYLHSFLRTTESCVFHKLFFKWQCFFYIKPKLNFVSLTSLLLIALLFNFFKAKGFDNYLSGSRQAALANCGVSLRDLWSVSYNQAGIAYIKAPVFGLYNERKFLLKELSFSSVAAVIPVNPGAFGFNLDYFGYSKYNETKIGIGYGQKLGKNFAAGVQLDYLNTFISGSENNLQKITYELGILYYPAENLAVGAHVFNPLPAKSDYNTINSLPSIFQLGLSYLIREQFLFIVETYKEISEKFIIKTGIEYLPVGQLALRMGISSEPSQYSFGLGYRSKLFWAGLAFTNNQILGLTPHLDVGMSF